MHNFKSRDHQPVDWVVSQDLISYDNALQTMQERVKKIQVHQELEQVWLLEHPPLYTLGTSAKETDVLHMSGLPVYKSGRGGQVTYHGPGQRVVYLMFDLQKRLMDIKAYVWTLEEWLIRTLKDLGVVAVRREGRVGLWVAQSATRDDKIAAIGVRLQKWVTSHGVSLNVDPDLSHYGGIIPCGIQDHGVTSLKALGVKVSLPELDQLLKNRFHELF